MATDKLVRLSNLKTFLTSLKSLFVAKESGKALSSNDYTTAEKSKLAGIATGANAYVLPTASGTVLGGGENWSQSYHYERSPGSGPGSCGFNSLRKDH